MPQPAATTTHLLYLHGFRSSPQSFKAQRLHAWLRENRPQVHWWCPQLPPSPRAAMALVAAGVADWPRATMAVVGSSLGGYYAGWVGARLGCAAVLLNPAAHPARDLARHVGGQTAWHDPSAQFDFRAEYVDELRQLAAEGAHPQRCLAVIARGDEVLDWREMVEHCRDCKTLLLPGGDHALSDFDQHLPEIVRFLHLDPAA